MYLKDRGIFANRSSFESAHDRLKILKHPLNGSIELKGPSYSRRRIYGLSEKGLDNLKLVFPDIYDYTMSQIGRDVNKHDK